MADELWAPPSEATGPQVASWAAVVPMVARRISEDTEGTHELDSLVAREVGGDETCRRRGMTYKAAPKAIARKRAKVIYAVMRDRTPTTPPGCGCPPERPCRIRADREGPLSEARAGISKISQVRGRRR